VIVNAIVHVLAGLLSFIGGLFPTVDTSGFVGSVSGAIGSVTGAMAPLGNWIPFSAAAQACGLVLTAIAAALAIKLLRVILSLFTGGGGGAA
jgi:hypothetical protein